jgi:hypothetical protein
MIGDSDERASSDRSDSTPKICLSVTRRHFLREALANLQNKCSNKRQNACSIAGAAGRLAPRQPRHVERRQPWLISIAPRHVSNPSAIAG